MSGRSEAAAALALPAALVLAVGPRGVGVLVVWAVATALLWSLIAPFVSGPWGRTERVGVAAAASLLAALIAAWIFRS